MKSIKDKTFSSIQRRGRGFAFSGKDFLRVGNRASVDKALSVLAQEGSIRRVSRGIYDYPRFNKLLGGELSPSYDQVVQAIARKNGFQIEASGAWAANLLGLSTQVPAKIVYLTDGLPRTIEVGKQQIEFRHVEPKALVRGRKTSGLVVQALRHLGKERVDSEVIEKIRTRLRGQDRKALLKDTRYTIDWVYEHVKEIARRKEAAASG